jgi:predicted ATP-grasp superfamily ATP-dependent carboligase
MSERVMVTDAQMRSSVAVIRSLGKKGLKVTAGEETRFSTGFFSKYCHDDFVYRHPLKEEELFIKDLLNKVKSENYDLIFPVADNCLKPIIDNREELSKYTKIALPDNETFMKGYDKGNTLKIAMENGISCPITYFSMDELYKNQEKLVFPLIIKPRISSGSRGFKVCDSFEELINSYQELQSEYGELLVQEFIPDGGELGVYTLFNFESEPRAVTVQKRLRSYPVSGGPSTLRKTIKNETSNKAMELGFKLLKAMGWSGVAMVEFRIDKRDGSLKLMEVNPRFWGSLHLSILAGVDFPYLLYQLFMEGDVESDLNYQEDVYCRWLLPGDILWFLNAPHKRKNLKKFLKWDTPDDIISKDDIGPTFGFIAATIRYLFDLEMWKFVLRK